jgi:hypothetical protein
MEEVLGVSATAARLRESFLRKVGLVRVTDGLCELSTWTQTWRDGGDNRIVAALLHSRCQYLGEMLAATLEPCTTDELLVVANEGYGMGWDTPAQVSNRRGWLQSCGMLEQLADGHLQATAAGRDLLGDLVLHEPVATPLGPQPDARTDEEEVSPGPEERRGEAQPVSSLVQQIIDEVRIAATDSHDPDRLERATRDAFAFLGFRSEWLGGSGKTDVLLDAMLGRDDSYRVIIDCKSTGSGSLSDQQIDWVTLEEHRLKHEAQHVAIVGPSPGGSRLFERAMKHNVAVISVERLVGLCSQHAKTPLGLDAYRSLFAKGGEPDSQEVSERSEDVARLVRLAAVACDAIRNRANAFGRLTARDLFLIVSADPAAEGSSQEELQTILDVQQHRVRGSCSRSAR